MKGFWGKILYVDLTEGICTVEQIEDQVYEKYLSGVGLGAYILHKKIPKGADPLGPDNVLGFVSGILTGAGTLFTGRWMAVCKSPLTGTWGDANCGGNLAPAIKQCGYDGIFFKGISEKPVYLYVDNKGASLKDASHLWGKDAVETEEIVMEECKTKKSPAVACIGEASENLSLISGISNDKGRIAARSGVGAVMGSKKLKAVALVGTKSVNCHNIDEAKELSKTFGSKIKSAKPIPIPGFAMGILGNLMTKSNQVSDMGDPAGMMSSMFKKWGTGSMNQMSVESGDAPIKNWTGTKYDFPKKMSKSTNPGVVGKREVKKYHCNACPLGCGGICKIDDISPYKETHRPEYETVLALGGLSLNKDLKSILYLNELLNRATMDSISTGGTVAFAIECYENGILTKEDTDGLELTWGNTKAIVSLVEKMIKREGIGDLLADGSKIAAQKIGKDADAYAIHAGGQELPMHDSRNDPGFGMHYSVEPTPGRHTIGSFLYYGGFQLWQKDDTLPKPPAKYPRSEHFVPSELNGIKAVACSNYKMVIDGSGVCLFAANLGASFPIFRYLNAVTGWDKTPHEYLEIGRRVQTLRQMFNIREGIDPKSLISNKRANGEPKLNKGHNKDISLDMDKFMEVYWKSIGWNIKTGIPTKESIRELNLIEFVR